jgi:hypothetical protein
VFVVRLGRSRSLDTTAPWDDHAQVVAIQPWLLQPPGSWYDAVSQRWFAFGRGRHWCLWEPRRLTQ